MNGNAAAIKYGLLALGLLSAIAFLPRLYKRFKPMQTGWINVDDLNSRIKDGTSVTIIDVRGPDEFSGPLGHIPTALNIPLDELPHRLTQINAAHNQPVILVCKTNKRSARAATLLGEAGIENTFILRGGMEQWNRNDLDVIKNGEGK